MLRSELHRHCSDGARLHFSQDLLHLSFGVTHAATRAAGLVVAVDTSTALRAAAVGVDEYGGRLHFDLVQCPMFLSVDSEKNLVLLLQLRS